METTKNKTTLLIMAAGMGSRFGSLKQLALLGLTRKHCCIIQSMTPYTRGLTRLFSSSAGVSRTNSKRPWENMQKAWLKPCTVFKKWINCPVTYPDPAGKTLGNGSRHLGRKRPYITNRLSRSTPMTFTDGCLRENARFRSQQLRREMFQLSRLPVGSHAIRERDGIQRNMHG